MHYHRRMTVRSRAPLTIAAAAFLTAIASVSTSSQASKFPDGPGKAALLKVCGDCHGPESAVAQFKTRDEWSKTLDDMAANGAEGTNDEWNQILEYLDKHFSLIFVNKADARELAKTLDVSDDVGEAVVKYRTEHEKFTSLEDLKKVKGLDAAKVDARKDRFVF